MGDLTNVGCPVTTGTLREYRTFGGLLEHCRAKGHRFQALVLLVAIAYTPATNQRKRMVLKQIQHYVGRVPEPKRSQKRRSDF
ncbi:hypothetical protein [Leptolyngbya sp. FACHB-16]|uniref:hypothetical protein n=1 Tax=unclassified Leptolyngbya TaxID=2650499 RepID=UPI0016878D90|nr:hypothetical protein [Leptolyngbya sp. FACHB-16]MBD2157875.1 hypothetical protein [Leptolyngbya sp. FACHB-16]